MEDRTHSLETSAPTSSQPLPPQKGIGAGEIRPSPSRLTVVEHAYLQLASGSADAEDGGYTAFLKSDEELYDYNDDAGPSWQPLRLGWSEDSPSPSCLLVKNRAPRNGPDLRVAVCHSAEGEKGRDMHSPKLYVAVFAVVPPGESVRLRPVPGASYAVASESRCRYSVYCFPG